MPHADQQTIPDALHEETTPLILLRMRRVLYIGIIGLLLSALSDLRLGPPIPRDLEAVHLGHLDVHQATAAIRAHEQQTGVHVPIIAMTAHAMKGDEERCLTAGMDGYISKPLSPQKLVDEIHRLVPAAGVQPDVAIVARTVAAEPDRGSFYVDP